MLSFTGSLKVFVALQPCYLRKSFNGLYGLVTERLRDDPRTGVLFVFVNQLRTRLKVLSWDGTGFCVMIKRLEQGTFSRPRVAETDRFKLQLTPKALALLTDGIVLREAQMRPWYERAVA